MTVALKVRVDCLFSLLFVVADVAFIVHVMGQESVAFDVHEMGTLYFHLPEKPVTNGGETEEPQAAAAASPSEKSSAG